MCMVSKVFVVCDLVLVLVLPNYDGKMLCSKIVITVP